MKLHPTYYFDGDHSGAYMVVVVKDAKGTVVSDEASVGFGPTVTITKQGAERMATAVAQLLTPGVRLYEARQESDVTFH